MPFIPHTEDEVREMFGENPFSDFFHTGLNIAELFIPFILVVRPLEILRAGRERVDAAAQGGHPKELVVRLPRSDLLFDLGRELEGPPIVVRHSLVASPGAGAVKGWERASALPRDEPALRRPTPRVVRPSLHRKLRAAPA